MSDTYNYEEGAIHNDHKKVLHISNIAASDVRELLGTFFRSAVEEAEIVEEPCESSVVSTIEEDLNEPEKLNFFAPTNSLQLLLKQAWFAEVRSDEKYDAAWTDAFVEALMASEHGEDIARQWQEKEDAKRSKHPQIKARLIGTLKDSGVLRGSYGQIAEAVGIVVNDNGGKKKKPYKSFADYMGRYKGRKPDYADWVREYVQSH